MREYVSFLVVPADYLKITPKAFQQYVEDYFRKESLFGKPCLVAVKVITENRRKAKGVAPSHSVDLMHYKEGLGGQDLNAWIRDAAKKGLLWEFSADWDNGCSNGLSDD